MATTANPADANWKPLLPYLSDAEEIAACVGNFDCFLAGKLTPSAETTSALKQQQQLSNIKRYSCITRSWFVYGIKVE